MAEAVHAVVLTYNSSKHLADLLDSIEGQVATVTVLDNCSLAIEAQRSRAICHSRGHLFSESTANRGFGWGVNGGLGHRRRARRPLLIVNPDCVARPGAVLSLVEELGESGANIAVPHMVWGIEPDVRIWYAGGDIDLVHGRTVHRQSSRFEPDWVSFVTGAAFVIRASDFHRLGRFREDLFLYWEDADLSIRARECSMKLRYVPAAVFWHAVGGSSDGDMTDFASANGTRPVHYYYYMSRNRLLVSRPSLRTRLRLACVDGLFETLRWPYRVLRSAS